MAYNASLISTDAQAVTPSDSTVVSFFGFYVGATGDVAVMPSWQESEPTPTAVTFKSVPAGAIIPLSVCRIMATNTSATNIVGFGPR